MLGWSTAWPGYRAGLGNTESNTSPPLSSQSSFLGGNEVHSGKVVLGCTILMFMEERKVKMMFKGRV